MRATGHDTKGRSAKTGVFAILGSVLPCSGSGVSLLGVPRRAGRLALAATLVLVATLSVGLPQAVAAQPHAFLSAFGSTGTGASQFELAAESGLAVDQSTGNVYLADTGNHRVDEFTASGVFIHAFGWGVLNGAAAPQTCTTPTTCRAGLPGPEPGQFEAPTFLAVDNAPGGAGDVYVADRGSVANERQTITVNATGGSYTLSYTSLIHGTTISGSNLVTDVIGRVGRVGDPISGPGIPPGTTIAGNDSTTLELSAPATASGSDVVLATTGTTGPIPYNANATSEELQGAIENLNPLEGNVCVAGNPGGPYTVEFCNQLAATNVPQMTADSSGLTGGTASATVETTVEGRNTARVQKFDPAGNLITGWGGTPAPGEVDGTTCTRCGGNPHFAELDGVAVKPDGKILVLDQLLSGGVHFTEWTETSGAYVQRIDTNVGEPVGIAVDPAGHLYLGMGNAQPPFEIIQSSYCETGDPSGFCPTEPAYHENFPLNESAPATGVAVDPSTEDVYVAQFNPNSNPPHSDVAAYESSGNRFETFGGGEIKATHEKEIVEAHGIAVSGSTSDVYVADPAAGRIEIFAPGGKRDALTVTRVGSGLGSVTSQPAGISCPFTCSSSFPVGEVVTLTPTAPEHSSFVGWSGGGCSGAAPCQITLSAATSVTATFAYDQPVLTIGAGAAVTRHTATLNGEVNPEGDASSCRFEYGPTSAYGAEASCASHPGSGASPVPVSAELWDLAASTTYHYRLVSANSGGATYGPDQTFTTEAESCATDAALCLPPPLTCATDTALCPPPPPSCATDAALCSPPPPLKCRKGYIKKTVKGRSACVKAPPAKCRKGHVKKTVKGKATCVKARKPTAKKKRG